MSKFRALLLLHFQALLAALRVGGSKKRAVSGWVTLGLMGVLCLYLSGVFTLAMARELARAGMLPVLLLVMGAAAVGMGLVFTLFAVQGVVYGGRDSDLLFSLPVSQFSILLSKLLAVYLENLVFTLLALAPAGAAWLVWGGGGGALFAARLALGGLALALLPTLLALAGGFVLSWLSGRLPGRAVWGTLVYGAFLALVMVSSFRLDGWLSGIALRAEALQAAFRGWGWPLLLFARGVAGDWGALALFLLVCLVPFLLVCWLLSRRYQAVVTALNARGARADYRLGRLSGAGPVRALIRKEARRFFGTPIYLFNAGFGLILLVGGSAYALLRREQVLGVLASLEAAGVRLPLPALAAGAMALLLATSAEVTGCSISLEGEKLWILKEAPLGPGALFGGKVGFFLALSLPCAAAACVCLGLALSLPVWQWGALFLLEGLLCLCLGEGGLLINLIFPRLDAPNDTVVVKQSASALVSTLGGLALAAALAGLYALTQGALGVWGSLALCGGALLAAAGALALALRRAGWRLFLQL